LTFVGKGALEGAITVAPTIAYGRRKIVNILKMERDGFAAPYEPHHQKRRVRTCWEESCKGDSFFPWVAAYFLVKDTEIVTMMEIVPSCIVLVDCGVNFTVGTPRMAIPASQ
jgi:hypothetical protein